MLLRSTLHSSLTINIVLFYVTSTLHSSLIINFVLF